MAANLLSLGDAAVVRFLDGAAQRNAPRASRLSGRQAATAASVHAAQFLSAGAAFSQQLVRCSQPGLGAFVDAVSTGSRRAQPPRRGRRELRLGELSFARIQARPDAALAKLSAKPGEDGLPPDPQTEALVDELNETIEGGPDEGQSWEEWAAEIEALHEQLQGPAPCLKFDPPVTGECPLHADADACPIPCLSERPGSCDIDLLPFDAAEDLYDFGYSPATLDEVIDWEAVDIVQYAWALLLDNLDLVAWTACLYYGETTVDDSFFENLGGLFGAAGSVAECLVDKVEGRAPDVTIRFVPKLASGAFATTPNPITGGTIFIPTQGKTWQNCYVAKFKATPHGSAQQFCVVADLAATLLHELVHSCLTAGSADAPGGGDDPDVCSTSYLIENSFRWALGQRFPCLCATADCGYYFDDRLWRNDGAAYTGSPPWADGDC